MCKRDVLLRIIIIKRIYNRAPTINLETFEFSNRTQSGYTFSTPTPIIVYTCPIQPATDAALCDIKHLYFNIILSIGGTEGDTYYIKYGRLYLNPLCSTRTKDTKILQIRSGTIPTYLLIIIGRHLCII